MNINKLIGNTPIVRIRVKFNDIIKNIFVKLEYYNLTGSIKDRMANYIINESYKNGSLKRGMPIVEATSGNTGISFAALGALYNHPVHIFMPNWTSNERIKIMKLYGAKVYLVSREDGGFREAIRLADCYANEIGGFRPNQFSNELNILAHYNGIANEIIEDVSIISAFVNGIGTGGTLMGVAKRLKEYDKNIKIVAMEPKEMSLLSECVSVGSHKIEGVGDDFIPPIVDKSLIDSVITISDEEAINMTKRLSKELGLGVGISSGANFLASVLINEDNVVTVFTDDLKKYLSTDLMDKSTGEYISDKIELLDINVL